MTVEELKMEVKLEAALKLAHTVLSLAGNEERIEVELARAVVELTRRLDAVAKVAQDAEVQVAKNVAPAVELTRRLDAPTGDK